MLLAVGLIVLGAIGIVWRDFAAVWQPVPAWLPGREVLAVLCGALTVACGAGLWSRRLAPAAARALFGYLLIWLLALKVPAVFRAPLVEASWAGLGEIAVIMAGGWVLLATLGGVPGGGRPSVLSGERGVTMARLVFAIALPAIGLSHFIYVEDAAKLVPAWLPARTGWTYLTGAGHIAAGLGVLFRVLPRLAATLESWMIMVFTVLVWVPPVWASPGSHFDWSALAISWVIGAGAWIVADTYRSIPLIPTRKPAARLPGPTASNRNPPDLEKAT
jgi:uncharacterized membrane protein